MSLNPKLAGWQGRRVWLVGASTGIGRATAAKLHAAGARVAVSARSALPLESFAIQHPGSLALPLDATDRVAMRAASEHIVAEWGGLDMAVYCAGYYKPMRATAFDLDDALRHEQVNYVGALYMLDAVLPTLLRQKSGHISLVSSVAGFRGLPQGAGLRPDQGGADQPGRVAVFRPHRPGHRRLGGVPGLRGNAAHRAERLPHAGADQRR